jgi:hypothetical protein
MVTADAVDLARTLGLVLAAIAAGLTPAAVLAWAAERARRSRRPMPPVAHPHEPPVLRAPLPEAVATTETAAPAPAPAARRHRDVHDLEYAAQLRHLDDLRVRIAMQMAAAAAAPRVNGHRVPSPPANPPTEAETP